MANKNNTREGIHSGLSQSKSDEKWSDMLNFRSNDNRTFAIPRKLGMLQHDAGLHTVLHGVGDLNYAIGSKKSFVFRSHDGTEFKPLWQARLERQTSTEDQSENLRVRGSYLGSVPLNIRVTVLDGVLVLDKDWPEEPVEVVETEPAPELNCDPNQPTNTGSKLKLTITVVNPYPNWTWGGFNTFQGGQLVRVANPVTGVGETHAIAMQTNTATDNTLTAADAGYTVLTSTQFSTSAWRSFIFNNVPGTSAYIVLNNWLLVKNVMYQCILNWDPMDTLADAFPPFGSLASKYWTPVYTPTKTPLDSSTLNFTDIPVIVRKSSVSYLINDLVSYNGKVFKSKSNHTSALSHEPEIGGSWATYWNLETLSAHLTFATGADLAVWKGTKFINNYKTNANGLLTLNLASGVYTLTAAYPAHNNKTVAFTKTGSEQTLTIQIP